MPGYQLSQIHVYNGVPNKHSIWEECFHVWRGGMARHFRYRPYVDVCGRKRTELVYILGRHKSVKKRVKQSRRDRGL